MRIGPIARRSLLAAPLALLLAGISGSASADEVVYPPGSRIGLVPLHGIVALKNGLGFENPDNNLVVTFRELPISEYEALDEAVKEKKPLPHAMGDAQSFDTAAGKGYLSRAGGPNSGPKNNRIAIVVSDGKVAGYVAVDVPEAATKDYSDQAIRQMLASTRLRSEVPAEEQLALLPFKVADLSGFKNVRTLVPGQAVMLLDGDEEAALSGAPYVLISIARVSADQPDGRERLARQLASTIPGIRDGTNHQCRADADRRGPGPRTPRRWRPASRTTSRSPSCSGCASAAARRCGSSRRPRVRNGRRRSRVSVPCATASTAAEGA